ncbi:MAG: hypothetical protein SynsKO_14950 [Synoicihabitans sp.]
MNCRNRIISCLVLAVASGTFSTAEETSAWELTTPKLIEASPAAGKRVRQTPPEYADTEVHHSLYLPTDWTPGKSYPVIVEYTGNYWPTSGSSGEVKDANLGYGLGGPSGFIWVVMPYVAEDLSGNEVTWWGSKDATIDYCKTNLPRICAEFGGDPERVVVVGFSRGAIGTSYIGLADDEIAGLWAGIMTFDHFDGAKTWSYPESDRTTALTRLSRLQGRPVLVAGGDVTTIRDDYLSNHLDLADFSFLSVPIADLFDIPEGPIVHPHTDLWMHQPSDYRNRARDWLRQTITK